MPTQEAAGRAWVDAAMEAQTTVAYDETDPETRVFVVPEAVASIASYLVSLKKRSGLHALVDIGSGTTDLSIFNLSIDRRLGSKSFWYASRSIPMGTAHIEDALGQSLAPRKKSGEVRLPHTLRSTVPSRSESMVIARELETIWMRTRKGWAIAYGRLKRKRSGAGTRSRSFSREVARFYLRLEPASPNVHSWSDGAPTPAGFCRSRIVTVKGAIQRRSLDCPWPTACPYQYQSWESTSYPPTARITLRRKPLRVRSTLLRAMTSSYPNTAGLNSRARLINVLHSISIVWQQNPNT